MSHTFPHNEPLEYGSLLSFRHMYNAEYRPGEHEQINYIVQRRKRMESVNPCPKCGDECECGPNCGCGSECECCGIVSEATLSGEYKYVVINRKSDKIVGFTNNEKDVKDKVMSKDYKYVKLKKPISNKDGNKMIGKLQKAYAKIGVLEVSNDTLRNYKKKASNQVGSLNNLSVKKKDNRYSGIKKADNRLKEGIDYTHVAVDKKGLVIGFASDEKDAKDMARRNSGKVVKLKKPMSDKKGDMMVNRPFKENTLMRFKNFIG